MTALLRCAASLLVFCVLLPAGVRAQEAGRWELEVHGGGIASGKFSGGSTQLPASGPTFAASSGRTSRQVSSWYFGDGADLLSQVGAQLGAGPGLTTLDAVLGRALADRATGGHLGFRISRGLSPRFALELTFDYSAAPVEVDPEVAALIEASRASFASTWEGVVSTGPFTNADVSSTLAIEGSGGRQTFATATVNFNLRTEGRVIPYLAAGGGVVSSLGTRPEARLEGRYQFDVSSTWPLRETDRVTVSHQTARHAFTGVLGGGIKLMASPRWGVRLDARLYLSDTASRTILEAAPASETLTPAGQLSSVTTPSLQLSNNPAAGFPSSLTGPEVSQLATFEVSGIRPQLAVSGGVLWTF